MLCCKIRKISLSKLDSHWSINWQTDILFILLYGICSLILVLSMDIFLFTITIFMTLVRRFHQWNFFLSSRCPNGDQLKAVVCHIWGLSPEIAPRLQHFMLALQGCGEVAVWDRERTFFGDLWSLFWIENFATVSDPSSFPVKPLLTWYNVKFHIPFFQRPN